MESEVEKCPLFSKTARLSMTEMESRKEEVREMSERPDHVRSSRLRKDFWEVWKVDGSRQQQK